MLKKNVETFMGCDADYRDADIVLFGAPYDCTTSFRPGTRFASSAIRRESYGLELYSPYQDRELNEFSVFDSGDLELQFGDPRSALPSRRGTPRNAGQRTRGGEKISRSAHSAL